ncbi:MAG: oxidoreductase, partial [Actinomycetota bacterium]
MAETLKSVQDIHDDHGPTDSSATFDRLWSIMGDVKAKIDARFQTERDPSTDDLESYGGETGPRGTLAAYVGEEIDWMIHSWIGDPETGFTNMHLTAWLGPQVKVPHLGMAWGTLPDLWCYIDLQPRADLMVDLEHLDRYFEPFNERFLELREREDLSPFVSRELFIRESVTPTACCSVWNRASILALTSPM